MSDLEFWKFVRVWIYGVNSLSDSAVCWQFWTDEREPDESEATKPGFEDFKEKSYRSKARLTLLLTCRQVSSITESVKIKTSSEVVELSVELFQVSVET